MADQGPTAFESTSSPSDEVDHEIRNINSFYSPIGDSDAENSSKVMFVANRNNPAEEKLRRRLAFNFMNPIEKLIARRQTPWKLILQFVKILVVTCLLIVYGEFRSAHTVYFKNNHVAFEHWFLKDWDSVREINAYPPSTGRYALYKKNTFYAYFNFAASAFANLDEMKIVPTVRNTSLNFCFEYLAPSNEAGKNMPAKNNAFEQAYLEAARNKYDGRVEMRCLQIDDASLANFDSKSYLKAHDFEVPWETLSFMQINFTLNTVTLQRLGRSAGPECFRFMLAIEFDNKDHDQQIPVELTSKPQWIECPKHLLDQLPEEYRTVLTKITSRTIVSRTLSILVGLACIVSFVLCCRALIRGSCLAYDTKSYFRERHNIDLTLGELMQFVNFWYILICVNDLLIIVGTLLKELIESRCMDSSLWDFCSLCLGLGSLLMWLGMLRYFSFFRTYNIIILALVEAVPDMLRFAICVATVYIGYVLCGWLVLGPYDFKFTSLSSASECLFSLINGDDMFATFSMVSTKSWTIWAFSRVYLYLFVVIFIYVVLSLFISIVMDAYEAIKHYQKFGFPKSRVDEFRGAVEYDIYSDDFCDGTVPSFFYKAVSRFMMWRRGTQWQAYERDSRHLTAVVDNITVSDIRDDQSLLT